MLDARTGKPLSSESAEAARLYLQAVDLILGSESGAAAALDRALELDKDFAMAAAARYYVALDVGETDAGVFREWAVRAALQASDWEREHIEVLIGLMAPTAAARARALSYIETMPGDLLVISQLTRNMFFYDGPEKLQTVLAVFESVEATLAHDWAFLARLGFAASEAGQRRRGRALIERALAIRPQALYSIHALAHLLHDEGAAAESAALLRDWLKRHEAGARNGQMYGHVQWHLALSEWQMGDRDAAMARYLAYCAPATTTCGPILTLADCGGFLLRDYLKSGQPRPLGKDVLDHIETVWSMLGHPFVALHVAALYASAGDIAGLKRCEAGIAAAAEGDKLAVSLALVSSLLYYVKGEYLRAAQTLAGISPGARIGIGGSNVERILVDLLEARCQARR
ncbi:hypothetical protein [Shewanella salipaludis]|uniref:Tetratricopeptide repeat protein 38 n=1 Tax=Shewanella salipaludis TaxID=2723052 RepID=A0A972JNX3_9GAMM|nr:hypothetical protein [Shewanella salipaludis]NMH66591.1 hypothetical protein [Shewanella salipaludis]